MAFEKGSGSPAGVVLLKKKAYDPVHLRPLSEHPTNQGWHDKNHQKLYWELSYCIRETDQCSMCLGDICIFCGIEEELNMEKKNIHMGLVLSYGLFLQVDSKAHRHTDSVTIALCNVDDATVRKTSKLVVSKLQRTSLLGSFQTESRFSKPGSRS